MTGDKRVAIVTGGASGIGLAMTRLFASEPGTHVCILDVDANAGSKQAASLAAEFPLSSFTFLECNVADWDAQAAAFGQTYKDHGRIDLVAANAGIVERLRLTDVLDPVPRKPDLSIVDINVSGMVYTVQLGIFYMAKNPLSARYGALSRGNIVCMASCAGIYPFAMSPLYTATKHATVGLVRSLARPLAQEDLQIQINALAPGPIETGLSANSDSYSMVAVTPMETLVKAVTIFVTDRTRSGEVAELHRESISFPVQPPFEHDETRQNMEVFWKLGYT